MNHIYQINVYGRRIGFYASMGLAVLILFTFALAIRAVPSSGSFSPGNSREYPYLEYYARDYLWLYPAVIQLLTYALNIIAVHMITPLEKKIFSRTSLVIVSLSCLVLLIDYYVQCTIVPKSYINGEPNGVALISLYNGHDVFIALEEIGYFMLSLAFLFLTPVFSKNSFLERSIRWILVLPFILTILFLIMYSIKYGIESDYRLGVAVITVNWLTLITLGILMSIFYRKLMLSQL